MNQTELMTPGLLETMDRAGFDILNQNQPQIIEEIKAAMAQGATAKDVEARMTKRYGLHNLTAALVVCAAYYIERNGAGGLDEGTIYSL